LRRKWVHTHAGFLRPGMPGRGKKKIGVVTKKRKDGGSYGKITDLETGVILKRRKKGLERRYYRNRSEDTREGRKDLGRKRKEGCFPETRTPSSIGGGEQ